MKIRFYGPVLRPPPEVVAAIEAGPSPGTIDALLEALGYSEEHRRHVVVLLDGSGCTPTMGFRRDRWTSWSWCRWVADRGGGSAG